MKHFGKASAILSQYFMLVKEDRQIIIIKQMLDSISNICLVAAEFCSTGISFFLIVTYQCDNFNIRTHFITSKTKSL